ncbi:4Fe-4S binding protein [Spirochaetota bacterium]
MKKYVIWSARILFLALFGFLMFTGKMMLWLALYGVSLSLSILFGRIYCGYICPMNTLMIPVEKLSVKVKIQTDKKPKDIVGKTLPWATLIITVAVMLLSKKLLKKDIPMLLIWLGLSIFITIRYKPEVFHNYICPFGALQNVFGRFAIFSHRVKKESCIGCKLCERVCPTSAIKVSDKKAEITESDCLQCTNCSEVCPTNTIKYTTKSKVDLTKITNKS